jgi:multiple antibiotic resistance protein
MEPMFENIHPFLQILFFSVITLFPVVNPVGTAFMVSPYFNDLSIQEKRAAVKKISFYAFCICTVSVFVGQWVLEIFGLSIPIIQLAGGIMICKLGWESLTSDKKKEDAMAVGGSPSAAAAYENIKDKLFYPITFPVTTGAGTISVLFTLSAHSASSGFKNYFMTTSAVLLAIVIMCLFIYFMYFNTKSIIKYLGSDGEKIVNRIFAFLIFCVGLQIAITGIKSLI